MWLRILLIGILFYLLVNLLGKALSGGKKQGRDDDGISGKANKGKKKGVPDDLGEYVDYEEVDDD
ncbi:MAG: hypothetical protein KFF49_01615 [Bacteroidales bacterium]|nr:hypothetical protein [Bacteroidales bacterium]